MSGGGTDTVAGLDQSAQTVRDEIVRTGSGQPTNSVEQDYAWWAEMKLEGIDYSLPLDKAISMGWTMTQPEPGVGNARFVVVRPACASTRKYLKWAAIGQRIQWHPYLRLR